MGPLRFERRASQLSAKADLARKTIKIENAVASTAIGYEINLKSLTIAMESTDYDPKRFPGLVYRIDKPEVVALLFGSGKPVVAGGKKPKDAEEAVDRIVKEPEGLALI